MADGQADFTNTFRALGQPHARDQFLDPAAYDAWLSDWRARVDQGADPAPVMARANPWVIARNHRVEEMIAAALKGDLAPFERLMAVLARPHEETRGAEDLTAPPLPHEVVRATFCGT